MNRVYYGLDVVKGKKAFMAASQFILVVSEDAITTQVAQFFKGWESFDHYKKLTESAGYPALVESMKPAMAGPLQILHMQVNADPTTALEAPVTEVTLAALKEGKIFEEVRPLGDALDANAHLAKGGHPPSSWGPAIQDSRKMGGACGWDSVAVGAVSVVPFQLCN